jgi:hypothetical protein
VPIIVRLHFLIYVFHVRIYSDSSTQRSDFVPLATVDEDISKLRKEFAELKNDFEQLSQQTSSCRNEAQLAARIHAGIYSYIQKV